jgi:pimeloyl-ACP methyl ester carboxylesterase
MQLFYREINETQQADATPLLILHGFLGSCDNWLTVSKQIAQKFRVFLIDLRNHGRSAWAEEHNYTVMANDIKEFIDTHQLHQPIIMGHSMGGKTAMQFAAMYPNTLQKLVVVDISLRKNIGNHQYILAALQAIDLPTLHSRNEADTTIAQYEPDTGVRQFLLKNLYRDDQNQFAWRMNLKGLVANYENILAAIEFSKPFQKPTLFIRGEKSDYVLDAELYSLQVQFPDFTLKTVKNAGHWVQAEQPQAFLEALMTWL